MKCEVGWMRRWMSGKWYVYVGGKRSVDLRFLDSGDGMGGDGWNEEGDVVDGRTGIR